MSSIVRRSNLSGDLPSAIVETADTPHRRQCNRVSVNPEKEVSIGFLIVAAIGANASARRLRQPAL